MLFGMKDTLVIDLETKKSFAEVGGEKNIKELGISVAGVYSYIKDAFFVYEEHELGKVQEMINESDHIIGFNIIHFDLPVLEPYVNKQSLDRLAVTDLYVHAVNFLGHRVGLGALAQATLGENKSGHGLEALQWFREGRIEEVKKYCLDDVRLTRDLFEYGKKNGHVLFESYVDKKIHSIPVSWGGEVKRPIGALLEDALQHRRRLKISYVSSEDNDGLGYKKDRLIDIYKIKNTEVEAYCHLRNAVRNFRIARIADAEFTGESFILPQDVQGALF